MVSLSVRRRASISRSLVTVLALTLLQSVAAPIGLPGITTPKSQAVSGTFPATSSTSRLFITIPAGVESITLVVTGGGGGQGGNDGAKAGGSGGLAGRVTATFAVTPGDVVTLMPGNAGLKGVNASKDTGGVDVAGQVAGGASTVTDNYWKINGTSLQNPNFSGGAGGKVGFSGSSGSGGGGGAASVAAINRTVVAIAAGAGGGGGAGNTSGAEGTIGVDSNSPNSNLFAGGAGKNSGSGQSCTANDGGGGGGGGGGLQGGLGGNSDLVVAECSGRGGYRGSSFVEGAITSTTISFDTSATPASPSPGTITYSYDVKTPTACVPTSQTVDIYTVLKFDSMINCTWSVPANVSTVDIFAVGGGGGGGSDGGSGGGGGAGLSRSAVPVTPNSNVTIKVGVGGRGGIHNSWNADAGESSTVVTTSGSGLYALGGAAGGARTGAGGAGGTAPNNGAFAGGAGGTYPNAIAIGGIGNFGITNYFYGTQNTYGGGGGGGCYYETGSNVPGAAGRNGGGAGCSNTTNGQVDGINGTNGTGGGGGGGGAGAAGRVLGGKGGSGVVLIRYATNVLDAFPTSAAESLSGRWTPIQLQLLDSARQSWVDGSGTYANANVSGSPVIANQTFADSGFTTGSSKTNLAVTGGTTAKTTFVSGTLSNYTILHVVRYPRAKLTGGAITAGRIITASGGNYISGSYFGDVGSAYRGTGYITPGGVMSENKWYLSTDMAKLYRGNGRDFTFQADNSAVANATGPTGLGVNNYSSESTDWQMLDLLVFNRQLSNGEIRAMESYLARIYGLTLEVQNQTSDTDTAAIMGPENQYFYGNLGVGNTLNDTFTIEAWIKPATSCDTSICQIASKESTFLFGINSGILYWMLHGTIVGGSAGWSSTGIRIKSNEWHHVAMVKQFTGDKNGSLLFYLDGQLAYTHAGTPYAAGTNNNSDAASYRVVDADNEWLFIGGRRTVAADRFYGEIDEVKIWKAARSAVDIQSDIHSNDGTSNNLQAYYNFNVDALTNAASSTPSIVNLAQGGVARSDLYSYYITNYAAIESQTSVIPYTIISFPRTIITKNGGWKSPENVTAVNYLIAAGGGAGGRGDGLAYEAGGGGAGGVLTGVTALSPNTFYPVVVGVGGVGIGANPKSGGNSSALSVTTIGGGYGGYALGAGAIGGSGGGGGHNRSAGGSGTPGQGSAGVTPSAASSGGGGGGATASGVNGVGGVGLSSSISGSTVVYGDGGGSGLFATGSVTGSQGGSGNGGRGSTSYGVAASNGVANTGSGGGGANSGSSDIKGGNGGSGVVIVRYITATKPTYTKPTNAYLNVGMTETFTTNVAVDSATVGLTRTFKWESTTPTSNGVFTTLKVGTGAANAAFSWVPSDTSTSGSAYLYRLTVTDSDTAGLFITDSSTAFSVINGALRITGSVTDIRKTINVARSETFTISSGTPGYRYTLTPVIPGITLDTSTVGTTILRISDTATVGTFLETLTVTDSVSASVSLPLSITISAPPSLTATGEVVKNGQMLNLDSSNRWAIEGVNGVATNGLLWKDMSGGKRDATTNNAVAVNGTLCKAPTFSNDFGGSFSFNGTDTCYFTPYLGSQFTTAYTLEAWVRPSSGSIPSGTQILSQMYSTTGEQISLVMGDLDQATGKIYVGFYSGNAWRFANFPITPVTNTWMHIVGTYDGVNLRTYLNGVLLGTAPYALFGAINTKGFFVGKRWDSTNFFTGGISEVRAYSSALSDTQVVQNFNATKFRFDSSNQTMLKPSQKYGSLNIETFTVTSGGDTKTVSFAVGNRAGIAWDTSSIPGQIKLSVQESFTPGTYFDTMTVIDNLGSSTNLPISFTIFKADTLTISMDSATAINYSGSPITIFPKPIIKGLKGFDTATSVTRFASALYSETTTVPTNADTYTVRGAEPVFTIGSLSNYEGVIYETRTAVVRKINQRPLNIFKYGGSVGSRFIIQLQGGDGTGAVTETLTGVSTLTGCAISNRILTAAEQKQGFCEIRVVKAGDQNYFAETETAQLYFMAFVNNQPTGQVGSGSTIALNGQTSLTIDDSTSVRVPRIASFTLSGTTLTINGEGFGNIPVKITFERYVDAASSPTPTLAGRVITVAVPNGAVSGPVLVITAGGRDSIEWVDLP